MNRVPLRATLLLVLVFATPAIAQTSTSTRPVSAGDKLRITMPDGRTVTAVAAGISDSTLQIREGSTTRVVDMKSVSRVERVMPDPIRNGIGWGLLVGAGAGALLGAATLGCNPGEYICVSRGQGAMVLALMGAGVGTAVGGVGDAMHHRREVVYPPPTAQRSITLAPMVSARARGLSVSVRW